MRKDLFLPNKEMDSERRLFKMLRWMEAALSVKSVEVWSLFIAWKLTSTSGADKTWFGQKNKNEKKTKEREKRKKRKYIETIEYFIFEHL